MEQTTHQPRDTVRLNFCTTCERTDRWMPLKARHFSHGSLCPGEVVEVVYRNPVIVKAAS